MEFDIKTMHFATVLACDDYSALFYRILFAVDVSNTVASAVAVALL